MIIERGVNWILAQSTKRVAFLGISFKSGTDDVRESPFIELAERIIGKGCEVRIFDPNVQLARVIGASKDYLMQMLPHIAELLVSDASGAIAWAETIVVTSPDPAYLQALGAARPDQIVLDFARLTCPSGGRLGEGFLW
jgi:GDP-mannose 6-dehydrogenase